MKKAIQVSLPARVALWWAAAVLGLLLVAGCGGSSDDRSDEALASQTSAVSVPMSLSIPTGIPIHSVLFSGGSEALSIADRVRLMASPGTALPHVTSGGGTMSIVGTDTFVGPLVSAGQIDLRNRAYVAGDATSRGAVTLQTDAKVIGQIRQNQSVPLSTLSFNVDFGNTIGSNLAVPQNTTNVLAPGRYASVVVDTGATLRLSTGTYKVDSIELRPDSQFLIDDTRGPVVLAVRNTTLYHGTVTSVSDAVPAFALIHAGTAAVILERSFQGTVLAPRASLTLASSPMGHSGSFFAKRLEVRPDMLVRHVPFPSWPALCQTIRSTSALCNSPSAPPSSGNGDVVAVGFPFPVGKGPGDVSVSGTSGVTIGGGGAITGPGTVIAGPSGTQVGSGASTPGIISRGPVTGSGGSAVNGSVVSGGGVNLGTGSTTTGGITPNATIPPFGELRCTQVLGPAKKGDITLVAGRSQILFPGSYRDVRVDSGAKLYITDGSYQFDSFVVQAGGQLVVETTGGIAVFWVRARAVLHGSVVPLGLLPPRLFLGYAGQFPVTVGGTFIGTIVAPNADVELTSGTGHRGSIFARNVAFSQNVRLTHEPAPAQFVCGAPLTDATPVNATNAPVKLVATEVQATGTQQNATVNPPQPVSFRIPTRLLVSDGNAGNHTAILTFVPVGQSRVTCTYRGASTVSHPTTRREIAAGLEYRLVSCMNGFVANQLVNANQFTLSVRGDRSSHTGDMTRVEVSLGMRGKFECQQMLGSFIPPDQAVSMFESFSWRSTTTVAENNADGSPALYYANIYVRNDQEYEMLDKLLIHHQAYPLFHTEYPVDMFSRCGSVTPSGDLHGVWVFAVLPGVAYNRVRQVVLDDDLEVEGGDRTLFEAIVLRPIPSAVRAPNGSLSYSALREVGFRYRLAGVQLDGLPDDNALNSSAFDLGDGATLIDAFEFVFEKTVVAVRAVTKVLAWIDRLLAGSVPVNIDFQVMPQDDRFGQATLLRHWGPKGGKELSIEGVTVDLFQVVSRAYTLGVPIPTLYSAKANEAGQVHFDVANSGTLGITWFGGMCVTVHNDTARINDVPIIPSLYCVFPDSAITLPSTLGGIERGDFTFDRPRNIVFDTDAFGFQILAEMNEARDYADKIMHADMRKAYVLKGIWARVLTISDKAWAPCMRQQFTWMDKEQITGFIVPILWTGAIAELGSVVVDTYFDALNQSDIVFPAGTNAESNRGIATHEYGHFAFCKLVANKLVGQPVNIQAEFWRKLIWQTIFESLDNEVDGTDNARIVNESFADFFTGQVAGATNYFETLGSDGDEAVETADQSIDFCDKRPGRETQCLDQNIAFTRQNEDTAIGGLTTNWHDVVDGHYANGPSSSAGFGKLVLTPTNGDFLSQTNPLNTSSRLQYTTDAYGNLDDERAALPGRAMGDVVRDFLERSEDVFSLNPSASLNANTMRTSLAATMRARSVSWCDACRVMALHTEGVDITTPTINMWRACLNAPYSAGLGDPPGAGLSMNEACLACGANSRRVATETIEPGKPTTHSPLTCEACPPRHVPDGLVGAFGAPPSQTCVACPVGQIARNGVCVACPAGMITSGDSCVPCPFGQAPSFDRTVCLRCPADATMTLTTSSCGATVTATAAAGSDICPGQFWIDVTAPTTQALLITGFVTQLLTGTACTGTSVKVQAFNTAGTSIGLITSAGKVCTPDPSVPVDTCTDVPCSFASTLNFATPNVPGTLRVLASSTPASGRTVQVSARSGPCTATPPR